MRKFLMLTVAAFSAAHAMNAVDHDMAPFGFGFRPFASQYNVKGDLEACAKEQAKRQGVLNDHNKYLVQYGDRLNPRSGEYEGIVTNRINKTVAITGFRVIEETREGYRNPEFVKVQKEILEAGKAFGLTQQMMDEVSKLALEQFNALHPKRKNFNSLRALIGRLLASKVTDKKAFGAYWKKNHARMTTLIAFGKFATIRTLFGKEGAEFSRLVNEVLNARGRAVGVAQQNLVRFFNEKKESILKEIEKNIAHVKSVLKQEMDSLALREKALADLEKAYVQGTARTKAHQQLIVDVDANRNRVAYLQGVVKESTDALESLKALTPELITAMLSKEALVSGVSKIGFTESEAKAFEEKLKPFKTLSATDKALSQATADQTFWGNPELGTFKQALRDSGKTEAEITAEEISRTAALRGFDPENNNVRVGLYNNRTVAHVLAGRMPLEIVDYTDALRAADTFSARGFVARGFNNAGVVANVQASLTAIEVAITAVNDAVISPERKNVLRELFAGYSQANLAKRATNKAEKDRTLPDIIDNFGKERLVNFYDAYPNAPEDFLAEYKA